MFMLSLKRKVRIFFILIFLSVALNAQVPVAEQRNMAIEKIREEKYSEACKIFESLLERYPRDGEFNYYTGICLYKTDRKLDDAIEYLEYASSTPQAPSDVYYHLGKAYMKNYNFQRAKIAFNRHLESSGRGELKDHPSDLGIENAMNAQSITMDYNPFEILASSMFTFADTSYTRQVRGKGGILSLKHSDLVDKDEEEQDLTRFMFLPKKIQRGDILFYSGYSGFRKKDSDLFMARKNGRKRKAMEGDKIEALNTDYDEILPYYDPVGNDLYFSSEGHNSMGGFDVFKSHYDPERDIWSEPVNLGFPINSPDNDYFAMPGPDLGTMLLITDRQGLDSMLTVYKLILQEPKKSLSGASMEELKRIGNLGGISAIPQIVDIKQDGPDASISSEKKPVDKKVIADLEKETRSPEEMNISRALDYQKKSDSLFLLAKETRLKVKTMPDPNQRWEYQKDIIEWEKKARDYSEMANASYVEMESAVDADKVQKRKLPEAIEKDKEIKGITVYRFKDDEKTEESASSGEISEVEVAEPEKPVLTSFNTADEPGDVVAGYEREAETGMNRFLILDESPYNANNPFPVNPGMPDGTFYRIQLGVFSQEVSYDTFGGISPITTETVPGKSLTRFYAGKFSNYENARNALNRVKEEGFKDAFIVSWYNGEKVSLSRVIELEKRDNSK